MLNSSITEYKTNNEGKHNIQEDNKVVVNRMGSLFDSGVDSYF